jgi:hypothetical protein
MQIKKASPHSIRLAESQMTVTGKNTRVRSTEIRYCGFLTGVDEAGKKFAAHIYPYYDPSGSVSEVTQFIQKRLKPSMQFHYAVGNDERSELSYDIVKKIIDTLNKEGFKAQLKEDLIAQNDRLESDVRGEIQHAKPSCIRISELFNRKILDMDGQHYELHVTVPVRNARFNYRLSSGISSAGWGDARWYYTDAEVGYQPVAAPEGSIVLASPDDNPSMPQRPCRIFAPA